MRGNFHSIAWSAGRTVEGGPAGVVCAVLLPHAPVLVPGVGGGRSGAAKATGRAMAQVAARVMELKPETVVVISPHAPRRPSAFGLWSDARLEGSFAQFNAPQAVVDLPNDQPLAQAIATQAQSRRVTTWPIHHHRLDHGALVPLWFLAEAGWTGPAVLLGLDLPGEGDLAGLGESIAAAAGGRHRRIAIIASGDMSHRLTANAPGGFHPRAHEFDEAFIRLIRAGDFHGLEGIDSELREAAGEDAVDSTLIAAAATGWNATGHEVLSYEGPFGVGYGVAVLYASAAGQKVTEMASTSLDSRDGRMLPGLARRSVEVALRKGSEAAPSASGEYLNLRQGVFVTVRRRNGELRGCVGTPSPVCANVVAETWRNARLAVFQDRRFAPVENEEMADLVFEVSVLHSMEEIASVGELDPRRYGVIVSAEDERRGLLLPDIEGIETGEQQVMLARKKGRIGPDEPVKLQRFQVDHFEELP